MRSQTTYSWNKGGWFGSVVGCTTYLYLLSFVILLVTGSVFHFIVALAVVSSVVGFSIYLWKKRELIDPLVAVQVLIWMAFLAAIATFALSDLAGEESYGLTEYWWIFFIFPLMSIYFSLRFRSRK